jgi:hypothetical protein
VVATIGVADCYKRRLILLQPMAAPATIDAGEAAAVAAASPTGDCYKRWWLLLQAAVAVATSDGGVLQPGRRCCNDTTDATAKGWRRCYFQLATVLPKASSGARSGNGNETGMADSGEVSHRNRPTRESGY